MAISRKTQYACIVVGIFAVVSLAIQIYLMWSIPNRPHNPFRKARADSPIYGVIKRFLEICDQNEVNSFIADPTTLSVMVHDHNVGRPCRFFCQDRVHTFAVTASLWLDKEATLLMELKKALFDITVTNERDPRLPDVDTLVPMHYFLRHKGGSLHLVVFYERPGNFWWHAAPSWKDAAFNTTLLPYSQFDGAIDIMDTPRVPMDGLDVQAPMYPLRFLKAYNESRFIECNHTRAALFRKMYGGSIAEDLTFRSSARRVLELGMSRLDSLGIPFWLSSGTCLGWFRQCDLITYSRDVDFGIFIKDHNAKLIQYFKDTGVPLHHILGKEEDSYQLSFNGGDLRLDMFFFYEEADHVWNGGTQARSGRKFKYTFPKFTLCWTEFLEMKVRIPCQTEDYIEANYGKNWFEPVTSWDWKKSPPNVKEVAKWPKDEMDIVVQLFNEKGKRVFIEFTDDDAGGIDNQPK